MHHTPSAVIARDAVILVYVLLFLCLFIFPSVSYRRACVYGGSPLFGAERHPQVKVNQSQG
jgi:hypothetical protein